MTRRILVRSGLFLASLLAALALAEAAVRALGIRPAVQAVHRELFRLSDDPEVAYELVPLAPDGESRINSAGFRDREFPREKPPGVFRIVAVGDSVTFGAPRESASTYPKELERLLNACSRGPRFEVLNLGVTGYHVGQVAERLAVLGLDYHPDLVLYGYVLNDPQELSIELEALRDVRDAAELRWRERWRRSGLRWLGSSRLFLWASSALARPGAGVTPGRIAFRHRLDPGYEAVRGGDARGQYFRDLHLDPAGAARLAAGLERLAAVARGNGLPVLLALFPLFLDPESGPYPLRDVHELVEREACARGLEVLDLQSAFAAAEARFGWREIAVDFLHPSELGRRVAAVAILCRLAAAGALLEDSVDAERLLAVEGIERGFPGLSY